MVVVSLSIPRELVADLDSLAREAGFASRSETIRYAIRNFLAQSAMESKLADMVIATLTLIYDKLAEKQSLSKLEHSYESLIKTLLHIHLDERNCLEVMVVEGPGEEIVELLKKLRSLKGMKQVKLSTTAPT
jgi:CopG family nickel-responsive transcriptional regulator